MKGYLLDTNICIFAMRDKYGTPIEDYDLFIGCAAKVAGLIMVTDNVQHLGRIEGLEVENWIQR